MIERSLLPEQSVLLAKLAEDSNEKLETAGAAAATHAFNLGCSASLLPGLLLVLIVFFLTRTNWVAAFITLALALLLSIGLANLAALTARARTMERTFHRDIDPEIQRELKRMDLPYARFEELVDNALPPTAALRRYILLTASPETSD